MLLPKSYYYETRGLLSYADNMPWEAPFINGSAIVTMFEMNAKMAGLLNTIVNTRKMGIIC